MRRIFTDFQLKSNIERATLKEGIRKGLSLRLNAIFELAIGINMTF